MIKHLALVVGFTLFSAAGALAILPPDASEREPEIRAHRIKVHRNYEKRMEERRELMTREYARATAAIGVPPWELDRVLNGKSDKQILAEVEQQQIVKNKSINRLLVSIMLLMLIGFGVGLVKHATREIES